MNKFYEKQYQQKAKEMGFVFISFQSFVDACLYETIYRVLVVSFVFYIAIIAFPDSISQTILRLVMSYIVLKEIGGFVVKASTDINTYKNCWHDYERR